MRYDPDSLPYGLGPADPADLIEGVYVPAEHDSTTEDAGYTRPADADLVTALGLARDTRWVERVTVRFEPETRTRPLLTAHTIAPLEVVVGLDTGWRDWAFGSVLAGDTVSLHDTWLTSYPASAWDVEALAVRLGSVIYTVWFTFTIQCDAQGCTVPASPGGLVIKAPASRVTLPEPLPKHVRDCRTTNAEAV